MKVIASQGNEKNIQTAIDILDSLINTFESNYIQTLKKQDSKLNIQIIPNVKRIKLEKVLVAKELID